MLHEAHTQTQTHTPTQIQFESQSEYVTDCTCICSTLRARAANKCKVRTYERKKKYMIWNKAEKISGENLSLWCWSESRRHILDFVEKAFSDVYIIRTNNQTNNITHTHTYPWYMCREQDSVSHIRTQTHKRRWNDMQMERVYVCVSLSVSVSEVQCAQRGKGWWSTLCVLQAVSHSLFSSCCCRCYCCYFSIPKPNHLFQLHEKLSIEHTHTHTNANMHLHMLSYKRIKFIT